MTAAVRSLRSEPVAPLPPAVAEIGKIHFEGNIIPHPWYQRITLESGKPDLPAIVILAEIVYWYRPYQTLDRRGRPLQRKHFDGDMFQCTAAYFSSKFGFTKDQARKALKRIEDAGYIRREYRSIVQQGVLRNNIMFIEPLPPAIMAITHPGSGSEIGPVGGDTLSPVGDTLSPVGDTLSPVGDFFKGIETTTEITTETTTTTPNPSSTTERAAKPEAARGGVQDRNPESPASGQEPAALEPNEEKTASGEEVQAMATRDERGGTLTEAPAKLIYPAKLTEREREDIAQQVCLLPLVIAQQMLDVVQSQIQGGQIKKNPAAVLRGIVRKYRADPAAFDPSPGFGNAESRRRRAEAETRLRAASEVRDPVPATLPLPARQSGSRPRPAGLEAMLRATRQVLHMTG